MAQLAAWSPDFSHSTKNLRTLTEKDKIFTWSSEHDKEFKILRKNLGNPKNLSVFDVKLKTELLVDASILHGLAYILTQISENGTRKIIAMGSWTLTKDKKLYSIFEIEDQFIIFGLNHCSFYLRGAEHFVIHSDHQALCGIKKQAFSEVTNLRVLKLMEMCSVYSFSVEHIQGKLNTIADCLSQMPVWSGVEGETAEPDMVRRVRSIISREDAGLKEMKEGAGKDADYKLLLEVFKSRKTPLECSVNHPVRKYSSIWDRVSMMDEDTEQPLLVVDNQKIIVPQAMWEKIVESLHEKTHRGAEQMKLTLHSLYFWPTQKAMVDTVCRDCVPCVENKDSQQMEPFVEPELDITSLDPMEDVAADLFFTSGKSHLCLADRYSGYLFWRPLANETTC